MGIWFIVAARIIANPVCNVLQKQLTQQSADPCWIVTVTYAYLALACLPAVLLLQQPLLAGGAAFWSNILISGVLAVASNVLLVKALQMGDLSVLGPVNAYKAIVTLLLAWLLIQEMPSALGVGGVFLIVAGSRLIASPAPGARSRWRAGTAWFSVFQERGVTWRLAALVLSATEAVFLKKALVTSTPMATFVAWSLVGLPIALLIYGPWIWPSLTEHIAIVGKKWGQFAKLALATGIMQSATLGSIEGMPVGYAIALYQLSTLLTVLFGYHFFQEQNLRRRMLGALVMVGGAILIGCSSKSSN